MTCPKLFFNTNLRFLREHRRLSQAELAERLGLTRTKLQALESGKTVNPPLADLLQFSAYFRVSIDILLCTDLSRLGAYRLQQLLSPRAPATEPAAEAGHNSPSVKEL